MSHRDENQPREKPRRRPITIAGLELPLLMRAVLPLLAVPLALFVLRDRVDRDTALAIGGGGLALTAFLYVLIRFG